MPCLQTFDHPFKNRTLFYRFHGEEEDDKGRTAFPGGQGIGGSSPHGCSALPPPPAHVTSEYLPLSTEELADIIAVKVACDRSIRFSGSGIVF